MHARLALRFRRAEAVRRRVASMASTRLRTDADHQAGVRRPGGGASTAAVLRVRTTYTARDVPPPGERWELADDVEAGSSPPALWRALRRHPHYLLGGRLKEQGNTKQDRVARADCRHQILATEVVETQLGARCVSIKRCVAWSGRRGSRGQSRSPSRSASRSPPQRA